MGLGPCVAGYLRWTWYGELQGGESMRSEGVHGYLGPELEWTYGRYFLGGLGWAWCAGVGGGGDATVRKEATLVVLLLILGDPPRMGVLADLFKCTGW